MRMITWILISGLLGAVACSAAETGEASAASEATKPRSLLELERQQAKSALQVDRAEHDFGSIPIDGGNVETVFTISNTGSTAVRLVAVYTSCGCTSAVLEFADGSKVGPFGMPGHEGSQTQIDRVADAGEAFAVHVTFDPAAHGPQGVGEVTRAVTLHTEAGGIVRLVINANVLRT